MPKTAAEKAKERAVEKSSNEIQSYEPTSGGIYGLEKEDLNMPYVFLVRGNTENAKLKDGKDADSGTFYHSVKKTADKELEVIIALAKKDKVTKYKDGEPVIGDDGLEVQETVWRTIMLPTDNLYDPFSFTFKGMNYWIGWKEFLTLLQTEGKLMNETVVKLKSEQRELKTTSGVRKYPTTVLGIVRDADEDELAVSKSMTTRFSVPREEIEEDEMEGIIKTLSEGI